MNKIVCNDCENEIQTIRCPSCDEIKDKRNLKFNTSLDIIVGAILIISGLGIGFTSILVYNNIGLGSVFLSFYFTAVFYFFMGGITNDTKIFTKWFKAGGTLAAFLIILWFIDWISWKHFTKDTQLVLESVQTDQTISYKVKKSGKIIGELKTFDFKISELLNDEKMKNSILDMMKVSVTIVKYKQFDEYEFIPSTHNRSMPDPKKIKTLKASNYSIKYIEKNKLRIGFKNQKEPEDIYADAGNTLLFFPDDNKMKPHFLIVRNHYPAKYNINGDIKESIIDKLKYRLVTDEKTSGSSPIEKKTNEKLFKKVRKKIKELDDGEYLSEDQLINRIKKKLIRRELKECTQTILREAREEPDKINILIFQLELKKG